MKTAPTDLICSDIEYRRVERQFKSCCVQIDLLCSRRNQNHETQSKLELFEAKRDSSKALLDSYKSTICRRGSTPDPAVVELAPQQLIHTRLYLGWTREKLAHKLNKSVQQVSLWESARYRNATYASMLEVSAVLKEGLKTHLENEQKNVDN